MHELPQLQELRLQLDQRRERALVHARGQVPQQRPHDGRHELRHLGFRLDGLREGRARHARMGLPHAHRGHPVLHLLRRQRHPDRLRAGGVLRRAARRVQGLLGAAPAMDQGILPGVLLIQGRPWQGHQTSPLRRVRHDDDHRPGHAPHPAVCVRQLDLPHHRVAQPRLHRHPVRALHVRGLARDDVWLDVRRVLHPRGDHDDLGALAHPLQVQGSHHLQPVHVPDLHDDLRAHGRGRPVQEGRMGPDQARHRCRRR